MKKSNKPQISTNKSNRRDFLKKAMLSAGALGIIGTQGFYANISESLVEEEDTNYGDLKLTVAGYNVNRVKSLVDGRVKIKGCTINFVKAGIGDMNTSTFSGEQPYDITEIGLHPFMLGV